MIRSAFARIRAPESCPLPVQYTSIPSCGIPVCHGRATTGTLWAWCFARALAAGPATEGEVCPSSEQPETLDVMHAAAASLTSRPAEHTLPINKSFAITMPQPDSVTPLGCAWLEAREYTVLSPR